MRRQSSLLAAAWMAGWLSAVLTMTVAGREATREIAVFQLMELRVLIGIALLWPVVRRAGGLATVASRRPGLHVGRNLVHYGAQFAWFAALGMIPIAEVVTIEFTMPIWTAILAGLFLGERIGRWRITAIALGVAGVAVIVRPSLAGADPGQLVALAAAVGFGASVTMIKSLTRTDSATTIVFWMMAVQAVLGAVPALVVWQWPSATVWAWVAVVASAGTVSHYCMARAMNHADATTVVPMDFLRVPLTALAGWLIYAESLDGWMVAGTALILAGNLMSLKEAGAGPAERP